MKPASTVLSHYGETVFDAMSRLAREKGALNLGSSMWFALFRLLFACQTSFQFVATDLAQGRKVFSYEFPQQRRGNVFIIMP